MSESLTPEEAVEAIMSNIKMLLPADSDVGGTTSIAIENYCDNNIESLACGPCDEKSNGNGSLMRILPVVLYC